MLSEYYRLLASYVTQDRDVLACLAIAAVITLGYLIVSKAPRWRNQLVYAYMTLLVTFYLAASILIAGVKP